MLVIHGDCRQIVPTLDIQPRFVFADPPFNIGQNYSGYKDKKSREDYINFTREWITECWSVTTSILALHGPDELAELYLQIARELGFSQRRIAWVNWHYRFGQCSRSNWIDARCHCLIYCKSDFYTWNPEAVLVDSDRASKYSDKRIDDTANGGKRLPGTVWGVPSDGPHWGRVQGNNLERQESCPNQLPEVYLERLLRAYTNPGDLVLDPFAGSGTTAVVAQALGRECVTIDVSEKNCELVKQRLERGAVRV